MAGLVVYQDSYIGATIVSNRFIDEYMTDANDAQLKVYLYLVRMLNAHLETSISDIADRFNHTEKDVIRAFNYWEKKGLLTLDYDEKNTIIGVHLINLCKQDATVPSVEETHKKVKHSRKTTENNLPVIESNAEQINIEDNSIEIKKDLGWEKREYTAKELADFSKKRGKTLISLAEVYFGRPLSQTDLQTLYFMTDVLNMSEDLVDYLLQYCADKNKKDFRYAQKVAISWKERNISTPAEAASDSTKHDRNVYDIMNRLGKYTTPADVEVEFISKWTKDYGFSIEVIFAACDKTVIATDKNRFKYADGILSNWFDKGVKSLGDVATLDEKFSQKVDSKTSESSGKVRNVVSKNPGSGAGAFGKFQQSDIDYDALSKKIFVN